MAENNKETPIIPPSRPQNIPPSPQEQTNILVAQAINNLSQRMGLVEIEAKKANVNCKILEKTIKLIEKRISFNERKNE